LQLDSSLGENRSTNDDDEMVTALPVVPAVDGLPPKLLPNKGLAAAQVTWVDGFQVTLWVVFWHSSVCQAIAI
jgi:hypothetical protein